ncbi:sugar transferase [Gymnodinialimonas ceratoperidinii]|uniref:Sugar transferase n=1 Tax=Gymnodinialimonas ceratoperidinii TaxID=2856823 RepID=A0A8F6TVD7_9RHOB|nr:sugar transferase [Gymnodinialimonas ceratoperidinii]QXT39395.1 sugar transferase [Gymnodinialimonas ceratoperidinii]
MTPAKRALDLCCAILLSAVLLPFIALVALMILMLDGRPILYISERMKTPTEGFKLVKFRTMSVVGEDSGVSGGDKAARITRSGAFLRGARFDEVPQLWNVLKGDISFIGPRPLLRQYVERFPEIYARVLRSRPGISGLASIYFHAHEEYLLGQAISREETDAIYARACIPRKARLDLIYQRRRTIWLDMSLMLRSVIKRLR